ncbi:type VI secretion system Vgr family protein [Xanthomonas translucens]|uniref:type VI secretion system Vgr family protein n=2 Tax=Xanthomonas campestris pv. translucens TaxID=343 RepID=UPI0002A79E0A|nr:type VI secretion system Vgr family protein [Xanthomonas translucens]ELQ03949.1 Rhs element Vgr protein [Xanthomonas translucens DAR61454]MCT8283794.1 type VI secretion system tip protein VgrG [Xanthomonas translucens pv. undulosa]MCT8318571.1 type VI secretion system tip protein VgrG [Xanthomonas translucens pv. undulosa]QSQ57182.1 type VI secretion system tip protein VgrG [Xanthomonas translucens pv. undulosa]UKE40772.1 type VI secretion system tip protein VgrG [Xanthomonas translucens pv
MDPVATVLSALSAAPRQQERLLRLHTALGPDVLVAETLDGHESVDGGGFRFDVGALSANAGLPLDDLLGQPVLLELLTAESRTALRPFHGHVTAFERLGSNGGLARYRLVVEPWLALLAQRVDSYVFQDMSVVEIAESVFADYAEQGALAPAWRWELSDRSTYAKRSLTTQYEETDVAFLRRLLAEEGIAYWFEHTGAADSDTRGTHTLVLSDHNAAFADLGTVRYHRHDVTEQQDSVQQWSPARRWRKATLSRASWDYRSRSLRPAGAEATPLGDIDAADVDTAGPYGWQDSTRGQRRAQQQLDAQQVAAQTIQGQGTWRQLAPGTRFALSQHAGVAADAAFLCLQVRHQARNNLGADVFDALEQSLGAVAVAGAPLPSALAGLSGGYAPAQDDAEVAFYRNQFTALPATATYRPQTEDGHGLRLHPKPTVAGTLSAIVVSDGDPVQSDRDHRIKVQFPFQRGADASSALAHPGGEDNAPGSASAWTWVRVMTPWAGDNWGGVVLPRKGQEVLVGFLEGDIDRPVVIGSVYNGRGQDDAAHNQVGGGGAGATGNAPAWFQGNAHGAVFTGFKSQALAQSQDGTGGYQQLQLDDTPGQGRAQLSTTQHASTLTLGHLKGGRDNLREGERGFGVDLSTQAYGAVRAGQGLLLSSEPGQQQLAASQALSQLEQGEQLLQALADAARQQQAQLPDEPATLPAQDGLKTLQASLKATQNGSAAGQLQGGDGQAPGWSRPALLGSGSAGMMSLTPADQVWVSGTQTALLAGTALNWASQAQLVLAVAGGLVLYTQGSAPVAGSPNQERGIALHAAQGTLSARAHRNQAKLAAKTQVRIVSTTADIQLAAPTKHLLATAAGAYIKLDGDDIELGAPGTIEFKGGHRVWTGPQGASMSPVMPSASHKLCEYTALAADSAGAGTMGVA